MTTATYTIQDFVRDAQRIVDRGDSAERTIAAISGGLERIINRPDCLADLTGRDDPNPDEGFSIHRSDNLTINAVVWAPDSGAPIHNHNGWAMEGVISGIELNRNFDRTDDGTVPWYATLEERDPTRVQPGETTFLPEPPSDIHAVEILHGKTVAIHVYGLDLYTQWRYRFDLETGKVTPFGMRARA